MRSSRWVEARPVRTVVNSCVVDSTDLRMRSAASSSRSLTIPSSIPPPDLAGYDGPDALAGHYPLDVALVVHVEDVDRQVVVHAESERGGVHHAEPALDRLAVRDLGEEVRVGVLAGVGVVHALH